MKKALIFRGKRIFRVGFFGLGSSNSALLDYLSREYDGLSFVLRSDKQIKCPDIFSKALYEADAREDICEDVLFLSPSVRRDAPELIAAAARGVILSSDVEFFFEKRDIKVFSVTGSDGKSTTSTLASLMMSGGDGSFPASANIGLPLSVLLGRSELSGTVAELSSFQLMNFMPKSERALITNVSENHLDWHRSYDEYASAKENVLRLADKRIFNLDCPTNLALTKKYPAYAVYSREIGYEKMRGTVSANHYFSVENDCVSVSGIPIFKRERIKLTGKHNLSNFLAAMALTWELAKIPDVIKTAETFTGLSHRARAVASYDGICFCDSSIDSTPTRTRTTLSSISSPIILILGGRGKKLSYSLLVPIPENVRAIILTGENRFEIESELLTRDSAHAALIPIYSAESFSDAVLLAIKNARRGDTVLLSPASTSFDSFSDYKERGNAFSDIIKNYYAEK